MLRTKLQKYLHDYLQVGLYKDYCPNGLIVEGKEELTKGIAAVSLTLEVIEHAIQQHADFILVHHPDGFFKGQNPLPVGLLKKRLQLLLAHDISVFGYHLPLDAHQEVGNNAQIAQQLGATLAGTFLPHGNREIGIIAKYSTSMTMQEVMNKMLAGVGPIHHSFLFGPSAIDTVAICSGGTPAEGMQLAQEAGAQLLVCGEAQEYFRAQAQELNMNSIAAGHHATEVFGVQALSKHLEQLFGLYISFFDTGNSV
jgi:dinuclear metal center YbgI/SA1388 family protein